MKPAFVRSSLAVQVSRSLLIIVLLLIGPAAPGQQRRPEELPAIPPVNIQAEVWTLLQLQAWAEDHSPDLHRAAAEVEVQRGKAWQAGLYPNPELQGGSNQLSGSASQYFAMLSQEIVTRQKLQLDREAVCREVLQAELQFQRTRFDLLTSIRQTFYTTLAAQRRLEALQKLLEVARRSTETAQLLEKGGEGARGDTLLLELELERADIAWQNAIVSLDAARRQLAATAGDPNLFIERIEGDLRAPLPDYPFQLTQAGVLTHNALVQAAYVEIERNQILLRRAEVQPFPNLTIQTGYMSQVMPPHDMAIIQLSMPIPIWNKNQGNIDAARASIGRATHAARKTEVDLSKQLAAATGRYEIARQQVSRFEHSILPKANESIRLAQKGFQQGEFDLLRVLQSQRALIESELTYLNAQEARWVAAAEISGLMQQDEFPGATDPNPVR